MKLSSLVAYAFLLFSLLTLFSKDIQAAGTGYWHTSGNQILDSNNAPVRIAGVNWFGLETGSYAPHGLWARGYKEMMDQMKQLGFNTIRLPYSNDILNEANKPSAIDASKNPDLVGLSGLQVMDKVIEYANKIGMRVILDRHRPTKDSQSPLWYTGTVSEAKWIADWKTLANRYKGNTAVIGADLHNEPNGAACWACNDPARDWKAAAERAGNAVLAVNPNWLIFVEGIQTYGNHWYWWGGNLEGVKSAAIKLNVANRVVYSTHDYPQSVWNQSWFTASSYPTNLAGVWDMIWGYIHKEKIAPVLVGEFGSKLQTQNDQQWFDSLTAYLKSNNISWVFWSWNPNSGDTGGILADDWQTVNWNKQSKLTPLQMTLDTSSTALVAMQPSAIPSVTPSATATPKIASLSPSTVYIQPTVVASLCKVEYSVSQSWNNDGFTASITIKNGSNKPIDGWKLSWNFPGNQQIKSSWNGNFSQSGPTVTVTNTDWNKAIQAGNSLTIGFVGSYSGSNQNPGIFKVNDTQCL